MTKDNWIKALAEQFIGDINQETYKLLEAFISQVEKDAIEKTNKRWKKKIENDEELWEYLRNPAFISAKNRLLHLLKEEL